MVSLHSQLISTVVSPRLRASAVRCVPAGPRRKPNSMSPSTSTHLDAMPGWARDLSEKYYSGVTSMFVLHGNVRDMTAWKRSNSLEFLPLQRFLRDALFGTRDLVLFYDRG